ncbi:HIT family protein [Streptomyces sp. NPDC047821]|uniref:HIT family protein n=1 Tax=Streptomyces sp. NPDC047821 TaxID=3365488 RepID=UPI0037156C80
MAECVFCEIAAHRAPARIVHEDAGVIAFLPLRPATDGHTLVVPRTHAPDLWAMPDEDAQRLLGAAVRLGRAVREALRPAGMNVISSAGVAATQTVPHTHVHLVPRWPGDAMGPIWPSRAAGGEGAGDPGHLDGIARRIAAAAARLTG